MSFDVIGCRTQQRRIILEVAESSVAVVAEQLANLASCVIVIDVESGHRTLAIGWRLATTQGASAVLRGEHRREVSFH
mgnify:CR=1 FL=1